MKADTLWVIEDRLRRKRRYKNRRARPASAHRNVPADADWTVDVVVHDQLPGVFQPLSAEDVRGLLSTFPARIGAELRSVHLRLGRLEDDMKQDGAEPDPITGRPGYEEGPVWTPPLRGRGSNDADANGRSRASASASATRSLTPSAAALRSAAARLLPLWSRRRHTSAPTARPAGTRRAASISTAPRPQPTSSTCSSPRRPSSSSSCVQIARLRRCCTMDHRVQPVRSGYGQFRSEARSGTRTAGMSTRHSWTGLSMMALSSSAVPSATASRPCT
jgi:hypothetical protein